MTDTPTATHAVLYCDGGFDPHSKVGGRGVHGYTYVLDPPKKGTGNPKAVPTDKGYMFESKDKDIESCIGNKVTPMAYLDMCSGRPRYESNNESELDAFVMALEWLSRNDQISNVQIISDSRYVVQGFNNHVRGWVTKGWKVKSGNPVQYQPLWEEVLRYADAGIARGLVLKVSWAKGHSGEMGNTRADDLATRGKVLGQSRNSTLVETFKEAQGYWNNKDIQAPRLLQAPRWYFATTDAEYKREDGSHIYYVGAHGTKDKEDDLFGKPYADNFMGVVRVKEHDPVMECLRLNAMSKDVNRVGYIIIGHLDAIFSPKTYKELTQHGTTFLYTNPKRFDVIDANKKSILAQLRPAGLGFRGVRQWESLTRVLDRVVEGDPYYRLTDLTDVLYEDHGTKKVVRKLKSIITPVTKHLDVDVEFNLERSKDEPKLFKDKVRLILGGDILSRNQLAALAEDVKSVKVVTWRDSDVVGRYATLVELNSGDIGLWARTEANIYYAVK